ncbi:PAS domain-containing protein [Halorubrum sp. GN11_10-6_MGM]|uniref:PAS domain-containing protein n=1 Tax=Halorubrum sp. GN11_10-6_MGM TaxID=2518112 RepID=UPI0010F97DAE|nr:PAS domain-containing protein [Halorubrum sp. GN11_10-6_MGM]TKX73111.1 PAS domain-containing protein [Halorubrum sp. GN11_10-6_MGM]
MTLRRDALAALAADRGAFADRLAALADEHDLDAASLPTEPDHPADRTEREARLVDRVRALDDAPIGLTLTGPAYRDTPIVYVNRWFREWTGYGMDELRDRNPRLFQGPDADPDARADFREALSTWSTVTVELRNRRRDGAPFANRVTLRPLFGDAGTVTHWVAAQEPEPIEAPEPEPIEEPEPDERLDGGGE